MNATTTTSLEMWESAWEGYIDALKMFDETYPIRFKRGSVQEHNRSKTALRKARSELTKLDPDFLAAVEGV